MQQYNSGVESQLLFSPKTHKKLSDAGSIKPVRTDFVK